jgi:hypothetical protein
MLSRLSKAKVLRELSDFLDKARTMPLDQGVVTHLNDGLARVLQLGRDDVGVEVFDKGAVVISIPLRPHYAHFVEDLEKLVSGFTLQTEEAKAASFTDRLRKARGL